MTRRRFLLQAAGAGAATLALPVFAQAAKWPVRPLHIVVPFSPGGTSDVIARLVSQPLAEALGTPVVIDNRNGAAGNLGAGVVANATDAHTVLLTDLGALALAPLSNPDLPFRPTQLQGVTMLGYSPHLLAVHPSVEANTLKELAAWSQAHKLNVASSGSGTPNHLGVVEIALGTGLKWQHVPYRGGAAAITDTVAGTTQMLLNGMVATYPMVQAGKLKVIGVSKRTRMAVIASVPTLAEQGLPGFESGTYQGVMAPSSLPLAAVKALGAALVQAIRMPDIRARLVELGAEVMTSTPVETSWWIEDERKRWAGVIQHAGRFVEGNA